MGQGQQLLVEILSAWKVALVILAEPVAILREGVSKEPIPFLN